MGQFALDGYITFHKSSDNFEIAQKKKKTNKNKNKNKNKKQKEKKTMLNFSLRYSPPVFNCCILDNSI